MTDGRPLGACGGGRAGAAVRTAGPAAGRAAGALVVEAVSGLVTVQDLGRPGSAHLAVPPSGAVDPVSLGDANRLVGNPASAAGLEVTGGRVVLRAVGVVVAAVTGAPGPVRAGGSAAAWGTRLVLADGELLELGPPAVMLRTYVAVAGGLATDLVLGSRSTDLLGGLGPPPLSPGVVLPLGPLGPPGGGPLGDGPLGAEPLGGGPIGAGALGGGPIGAGAAGRRPSFALNAEALPRWRSEPVTAVAVHPGPRLDWFAPGTWDRLTSATWTVGADSNRVGLRLAGPRLDRGPDQELPSEGLVTGAVQVPTSGQPVVFLADHPTTGGYPVVAVVDAGDLPRCGQLRPGQLLRLTTAPAP